MELIYKRFEQRLAFWPQVELENFIEISAQEIVKLFAIPDVSQQRELLLAFMQMREGHAVDTVNIRLIDEFLKANNCG